MRWDEETYELFLSRATAYSALSLCFQYPVGDTERLLREWVPEALRDASRTLKVERYSCHRYMEELANFLRRSRDFGDSRKEYTRIFIASYPKLLCPPYESVYVSRDRRLYSDEVLEVLELMRKWSLQVSDEFHEPPEHVAVELDFAAYLLSGIADKIVERSYEEAEEVLDDYKVLVAHMVRWVPTFCSCVERESRVDLYRLAARALRVFVSDEASALNIE